ncbi:uncharacterized protein [Heliangelus exortis]|uniref:uncharacterized protein n=1 Tax=Heliangelus exortis TaxID=472823 RepID=UPI003A8DE5C9
MALRELVLAFLLVLIPLLLAWKQKDIGPRRDGGARGPGGCKAPYSWNPRLQFFPNQSSYAWNDFVQLSCAGDYVPSVPWIKCISNGTHTFWNGIATCEETCQRPGWWDTRVQMSPARINYKKDEEVTLSCNNGFQPSFTHVKCVRGAQTFNYSGSLRREVWQGRKSNDAWIPIEKSIVCIETCQRPHWGHGLQLTPDEENYKKNEEVMLSCPMGFQPTFTHVKCEGKVLSISNGKHEFIELWNGRDSRGDWIPIPSLVECIEKCQKPQWEPRFIFDQERETFNPNEVVKMKCPEGYWPAPMEIKCVKLDPKEGSKIPRSGWIVRHGTGDPWVTLEQNLTCLDVLQVVPGTLEISSTSIKLNWTCRLLDTCKQIWAKCRLEESSLPPCEAEEIKGEENLYGLKGTFTCPPLQPFTVYSVTISLPPNTILYTRLFRTKETVPDKPENLWLDQSTGSIRWKALSSCKGEIIGYQLNITTRSAQDGGFLQVERLRLNSSVTEHRLQEHSPSRSYVVSLQGLTAAGAGAASLRDFQSSSSDTPQPLGISCRSARDISPSQGTAVLLLHPIARPPAADREHQLIVAAVHDGLGPAVEGACSGEPQPFNASRQPGAYVAALLNLTAPTDFLLGEGTRGPGYHNAALRPGCNYTALLRLAHRSHQAEKFSCVCYSFSVDAGQSPGLQRGTIIGLVLLLVFLLLSAGVLWFVLSKKRKSAQQNLNG